MQAKTKTVRSKPSPQYRSKQTNWPQKRRATLHRTALPSLPPLPLGQGKPRTASPGVPPRPLGQGNQKPRRGQNPHRLPPPCCAFALPPAPRQSGRDRLSLHRAPQPCTAPPEQKALHRATGTKSTAPSRRGKKPPLSSLLPPPAIFSYLLLSLGYPPCYPLSFDVRCISRKASKDAPAAAKTASGKACAFKNRLHK